MASVDGRFEMFRVSPFARTFEGRVDGEITDIDLRAAVSDTESRVAILYTDLKHSKRLAVFDAAGKRLGDVQIPFSAEQVVFAGEVDEVMVADPTGNAPRFAVFDVLTSPRLLWEGKSEFATEYAVLVRPLSKGWAIYWGVEASAGKLTRWAELIGISAENPRHPMWRVRVPVPAGGYVYSFDVSEEGKKTWLAVATDLGSLSLFRLLPK